MKTGFKISTQATDARSDFGDLFIPRDLFSEGGLWSWGAGNSGQLGNNATSDQSSPVQTVSAGTNWKQVSCGEIYTAAIKTDGTLWLWGRNSVGQLGSNNLTDRSSPVQTVSAGTNWKQVSGGRQHTAAIKTDGTLWLWGRNSVGQLGSNNLTDRSSPVQTVSAGSNWKQVSCGREHTAAIKTDGTLWAWGQNDYGELATNNVTDRSSPVQTVSGGNDWKLVSCGQYHTAAIKTDGTLWLWGRGQNGQLGNNSTTNRSSPVQTVAGGTNWKQVACSFQHTAAIKTDGTLWLWGSNTEGRLGDNSRTSRSSPVQTVSGGTNWKQVTCGDAYTAATKTDGTLWLWGEADKGRLGNNSTTDRSSPVQTVAGGTNWKQVSASLENTATVREDYY